MNYYSIRLDALSPFHSFPKFFFIFNSSSRDENDRQKATGVIVGAYLFLRGRYCRFQRTKPTGNKRSTLCVGLVDHLRRMFAGVRCMVVKTLWGKKKPNAKPKPDRISRDATTTSTAHDQRPTDEHGVPRHVRSRGRRRRRTRGTPGPTDTTCGRRWRHLDSGTWRVGRL